MGGDKAPLVILKGIQNFRLKSTYQNVKFLLFGLESVRPLLAAHNLDQPGIEFISCTEVITGDTEPRLAVRSLKDASMRRAIEAVAEGRAQGVVSAGNTGAYMVLSKLILKTLDGIQRPAITGLFPSHKNHVVMLDLGANADVNAEIMVQFCLMGQAFSKCVVGLENPSVALLNIGSEEQKGNFVVRETHSLIQSTASVTNYKGFVEGNDIFTGNTDVIVADGFVGNVALKTAEGTIKFCVDLLKQTMKSSWLARLGILCAYPFLKGTQKKIDPRLYNGAPFLGLRGISVKSHGGTDEVGFESALKVAYNLIHNNVNQKIEEEVAALQEKLEVNV